MKDLSKCIWHKSILLKFPIFSFFSAICAAQAEAEISRAVIVLMPLARSNFVQSSRRAALSLFWFRLVISLRENHGAYFLFFFRIPLRVPQNLRHKWTYFESSICVRNLSDLQRSPSSIQSALRKWNCWLLLSPPLEIATKLALKLECAGAAAQRQHPACLLVCSSFARLLALLA